MSDEMRRSEDEFREAKAAKQSVREELKADLARLDEVARAMRQRVEAMPEGHAETNRAKGWWPWWDK